MLVNTTYLSIQGEGPYSGHPTVFVRFQGCNLSCIYCDTKYAQDPLEGFNQTPDALVSWIQKDFPSVKMICLTGGEPLMQNQGEFEELVIKLASLGKSVQVETNGTIWHKPLLPYAKCWVVDYKLPCAKVTYPSPVDFWSRFETLRPWDCVKFVTDLSEKDLKVLDEVVEGAKDVGFEGDMFIHHVNGQPSKELAQYAMDRHDLRLRVGVQLHKLFWDPIRQDV